MTKAKLKIEEWEKNKQKAGRKNRWDNSKKEYIKLHGEDAWKVEEIHRKGLEKIWKSQRDKERYQIEKLKNKLNPLRIKKRREMRRKKKIKEAWESNNPPIWGGSFRRDEII